MLPFGVTIPATVPQMSEIPEGLTNYLYGSIKITHPQDEFCSATNKRKVKFTAATLTKYVNKRQFVTQREKSYKNKG